MSEYFIDTKGIAKIMRGIKTMVLLHEVFKNPQSPESELAALEIRKRTNRWYAEDLEKRNEPQDNSFQ